MLIENAIFLGCKNDPWVSKMDGKVHPQFIGAISDKSVYYRVKFIDMVEAEEGSRISLVCKAQVSRMDGAVELVELPKEE